MQIFCRKECLQIADCVLKWFCLVALTPISLTLRWRGLKYGVVVTRRKELLCPRWIRWRKMYVLALILDASSSIEGKKNPMWSFTKDSAREILDLYFNPLRCGPNYLRNIYLSVYWHQRSAEHWIAEGKIRIVQGI